MEDDENALVQQWLIAEREAVQAEMQIANLGQGAADPRTGALYSDAREKRMKADALFHEVYKRTGKPPAQPR
jgi:ferritin-like protein